MYLFKDVKKHLSSKQTEGQPDRPRSRFRTRLRPRPRPRPRPRAPSPEPRLRPRLSSRFTKARRLPFFKYLQLFFLFVCFVLFCFVFVFTELQLARICHFSKSCNFFFPDTTSVDTCTVNPAYVSALQSGNF